MCSMLERPEYLQYVGEARLCAVCRRGLNMCSMLERPDYVLYAEEARIYDVLSCKNAGEGWPEYVLYAGEA